MKVQTQKSHVVRFYLHDMHRISTSTDRKLVIVGSQKLHGLQSDWEWVSGFFGGDENVPELDSSNGCTTF